MLLIIMKTRIIAMLLLGMTLIMSACTPQDENNLLRPPKLNGEQSVIQKALDDKFGNAVTLKYPKSGENRTAFIECELDGDGINEIIAFHKDKAAGSTTQFSVLKKDGAQWVWMCDSTEAMADDISRIDINTVMFGDLDGDGKNEIITGWSQSTSLNNTVTCFSFIDGCIVQRFSEQYTEMLVADLDNDSKNDKELFTVLLNSSESTSVATLYKLKDNMPEILGQTALDGKVTAYSQIIISQLNPDTSCVYLDGVKGANDVITEVVYYHGYKLNNPFYVEAESLTKSTFRSNGSHTRDINKDGSPEIPFPTELPGYEDKSATEKMWITSWYSYDGEKSNIVLNCVMSNVDGYFYQFPDEWLGKVTAESNRVTRTITFKINPAFSASDSPELLTITTILKSNWDETTRKNYDYVLANRDFYYAAKIINRSDALSPDTDSVADRLLTLD